MKKTIQVKGMHCKSCEMLIQDSLEDLEGVDSAQLDHKKGTAIVEYDTGNVDLDTIKKAIRDEGYEA